MCLVVTSCWREEWHVGILVTWCRVEKKKQKQKHALHRFSTLAWHLFRVRTQVSHKRFFVGQPKECQSSSPDARGAQVVGALVVDPPWNQPPTIAFHHQSTHVVRQISSEHQNCVHLNNESCARSQLRPGPVRSNLNRH